MANFVGIRSQTTAETTVRLSRIRPRFCSERFGHGRETLAMKVGAAALTIVIRPFEPVLFTWYPPGYHCFLDWNHKITFHERLFETWKERRGWSLASVFRLIWNIMRGIIGRSGRQDVSICVEFVLSCCHFVVNKSFLLWLNRVYKNWAFKLITRLFARRDIQRETLHWCHNQ